MDGGADTSGFCGVGTAILIILEDFSNLQGK